MESDDARFFSRINIIYMAMYIGSAVNDLNPKLPILLIRKTDEARDSSDGWLQSDRVSRKKRARYTCNMYDTKPTYTLTRKTLTSPNPHRIPQ